MGFDRRLVWSFFTLSDEDDEDFCRFFRLEDLCVSISLAGSFVGERDEGSGERQRGGMGWR